MPKLSIALCRIMHTCRSKQASDFLQLHNINWWKTPVESPHLSSIENLWHELKEDSCREVKQKHKGRSCHGHSKTLRSLTPPVLPSLSPKHSDTPPKFSSPPASSTSDDGVQPHPSPANNIVINVDNYSNSVMQLKTLLPLR